MCLDPQPQTPGLSRRHALLGGLAAAGSVSVATLATASPASAATPASSTKRDMDFALVPLGIQGVLFAAIGVVALIFVATQVPETRARSLEDLEEDVTTGAIYQVAKPADAHQS